MTSDEHDRAMDHEVSRNDEDILEEVLAEYIDRLNRGEMLDEEHVLLALKPGDGGDRLGVRFLNDVLRNRGFWRAQMKSEPHGFS
jgi:hypothetical protein